MSAQNHEFLDSIDALGPRPELGMALSGELLAEAENDILQAIVEEAARDFSAPIALVNFVLEEIQFFKAYHGLPPDLAAARGTERDVSFCQFVVRDGETFEVTNAEQDARVPQHLVKHYGIRSYLGVPVVANDAIVGSLCVIDTKAREFSDEDRQTLRRLAGRVNVQLAELGRKSTPQRSSLVGQAAAPALTELHEALASIHAGISVGRTSTAALATALRLMEHKVSGGHTPPEHLERTLKVAHIALENCENSFYDVEAGVGDAEDARLALEHVLSPTSSARLSEVAISGRELARQNIKSIDGIFLPDLERDPVVAIPRSLGVALVATCLSILAARMVDLKLSGVIRMEAQDLGSQAEIVIKAEHLPNETLEEIAAELMFHTGGTPAITLEAKDRAIRFLFAVVQKNIQA